MQESLSYEPRFSNDKRNLQSGLNPSFIQSNEVTKYSTHIPITEAVFCILPSIIHNIMPSNISALQFPPGNNYEFKFVAEGAANLVFEVLVPHHDENDMSIFNGEMPLFFRTGTSL